MFTDDSKQILSPARFWFVALRSSPTAERLARPLPSNPAWSPRFVPLFLLM